MNRIVVLGSLNIDLVQRMPRLPVAGETLRGGDLQIFAGGKGANQACAAARLGGSVCMVGKVGSDVFAERLLRELQESGVDTTGVERSASSSGSAIICVLPNGENSIVIAAGANADIPVSFALKAVDAMEAGDLLLCQLEIPLESVTAALGPARAKGVITILDPAPACPLSDDLLGCVSILTPNQTEAAILGRVSGVAESDLPQSFEQAATVAQRLLARGVGTVIIKMGANGCLIADTSSVTTKPGFRVAAVDTTAAGDTFNGALAAGLARGDSLGDATEFANAAAALSVTKVGALASIPKYEEVVGFLNRQVGRK